MAGSYTVTWALPRDAAMMEIVNIDAELGKRAAQFFDDRLDTLIRVAFLTGFQIPLDYLARMLFPAPADFPGQESEGKQE